MATRIRNGVIWEVVKGGEYGEHTTTLPDGTEIAVYTDRDGENWYCLIDGDADGTLVLAAECLDDTLSEALEVVKF